MVGCLLICMSLASLLVVRGLSNIPNFITIDLQLVDFPLHIHGLIHLLALPSSFIGSVWGEESIALSVAFLFLGLGFSLLLKKNFISQRAR